MTKEDKELLKRAMQYVESRFPPDCPYYVQLVRDTFNKLQQRSKMEALELFKKLPHLDYLYGVQTDWRYAPTLYHFDGAWHVTWIETEEGDSIKDFKAETPEEAIKKAFNWCVELKLIEK